MFAVMPSTGVRSCCNPAKDGPTVRGDPLAPATTVRRPGGNRRNRELSTESVGNPVDRYCCTFVKLAILRDFDHFAHETGRYPSHWMEAINSISEGLIIGRFKMARYRIVVAHQSSYDVDKSAAGATAGCPSNRGRRRRASSEVLGRATRQSRSLGAKGPGQLARPTLREPTTGAPTMM